MLGVLAPPSSSVSWPTCTACGPPLYAVTAVLLTLIGLVRAVRQPSTG
ncbi:hypothetical protein [Streptomyces sp. CBMA152]|nr:hypothetical protein [Streptomyces sp. CBMA152]